MSNQSKINWIQQGVTKKFDEMVKRAKMPEQFLTRVVKREYLRYQQDRWKTEDEGQWKELNPKYAERKKKEWAGWAGQGRIMMIASSRLYGSVIGTSRGFKEVITQRSIAWATSVPYAKYANDARSFTHFGKRFYQTIGKYALDWIAKGKL